MNALSKLADATLALPYDEIGTSWGTQKLVDVIRAMSPEELAELIGGAVMVDDEIHTFDTPAGRGVGTRLRYAARGPWKLARR